MALEILTLVVGQMQENCYLVYDPKSLETIIIDPGDDADYIERIIADKKLNPIQIIATHGHFDHIMAVTELKFAYRIPFNIHKGDDFLVKNMASSVKHFLGITADPPPIIDGYLNSDEKIRIGESYLEIIETPGHTPGSICLYNKKENILITGDLLFADGGVGRTDFSYSDGEELQKSLKKIFKLSSKTQIYPGHGRSSTLAE
ncbi:MBL fold metallo-hydrolase [Candidatus Gottesmanbacteria bacterium]|nr:MBL fold metallo-hydrolase [Candidatus Gottesmanbacteria bacterium]